MTEIPKTPTTLVTLSQLVEERPWLTTRWVRSLVAANRVLHWKFSGRLLFDPKIIDEMVEEGRVDPGP